MSLPLKRGLENIPSVDRVIEDLLVRFIINCPPEDLSSVERELFHFEEASWFYTDFIRLINPNLPKLKIKQLSQLFIKLCPLVWKWKNIKVDEALSKFSKYKKTIPVRGAAIFNKNMTKILLVKGTESDSWSFPRGKISKDEDDVSCCIREVKEEIGFDLSDYIDEDQFIERNISGKNYKIFLVRDIPENTPFKPLVRNEIEEIQWMDFKKVSRSIFKNAGHKYKFYLINSMIRPLSMWVKHQRQNKSDTLLKSQAEEQLKVLLGINQDEQTDPGRELLNMLQSNSNGLVNQPQTNQQGVPITLTNAGAANMASFMNNANPQGSQPPFPQQLMNGQQLSPQKEQARFPPGFQPFAPFPFVNNMHGANGAVPPQFMMPMMAPPHPQQQQQQHQQMGVPMLHPQQPNEQEIPSANALSKPSFAPSSHDNSRVLLNLLNSNPPKPAPHHQTQRTVRNVTQAPQPESSNSSALLNVLNMKKSPAASQQHQTVQNSIVNDEFSNSPTPELPSPSFSSPGIEKMGKVESSDDMDYTDFEDSTDSEVEEELEEMENDDADGSVNSNTKSILKENMMSQGDIPHTDVRSDSVASVIDESMREPSPFTQMATVTRNQIQPINKPKKFKILKRGEAIPDSRDSDPTKKNDGDSLLDILKKPSQTTASQPEDIPEDKGNHNVGKTNDELMDMLRKNSNPQSKEIPSSNDSNEKKSADSKNLLNILKKNPIETSDISDISPRNNTMHAEVASSHTQSMSSDLLGMLKKNGTHQTTLENDSAQLLNSIKHPSDRSQSPYIGNPLPVPTARSESTSKKLEDTSNELLDMLKRNKISDDEILSPRSSVPSQITSSSSNGHELLNMIQGNHGNQHSQVQTHIPQNGMNMVNHSMHPAGMMPSGVLPPGMVPPGMSPPGMSPPGMVIPGMIPSGMASPGAIPQNMSSSQRTNATNNELLSMLQNKSQNSVPPSSSNQSNAGASAQLLSMLHK